MWRPFQKHLAVCVSSTKFVSCESCRAIDKVGKSRHPLADASERLAGEPISMDAARVDL